MRCTGCRTFGSTAPRASSSAWACSSSWRRLTSAFSVCSGDVAAKVLVMNCIAAFALAFSRGRCSGLRALHAPATAPRRCRRAGPARSRRWTRPGCGCGAAITWSVHRARKGAAEIGRLSSRARKSLASASAEALFRVAAQAGLHDGGEVAAQRARASVGGVSPPRCGLFRAGLRGGVGQRFRLAFQLLQPLRDRRVRVRPNGCARTAAGAGSRRAARGRMRW